MLHSSVDITELNPPVPIQVLLNPLLLYTNNLILTFISAGLKKGKSEVSLVGLRQQINSACQFSEFYKPISLWKRIWINLKMPLRDSVGYLCLHQVLASESPKYFFSKGRYRWRHLNLRNVIQHLKEIIHSSWIQLYCNFSCCPLFYFSVFNTFTMQTCFGDFIYSGF